MNLFEAGMLPAIPIGGIIGGVLCKSFGVFATIGGVLAGLVAGGIVGWCYAFLIMFMVAVVSALWNAACKRPAAEVSEAESQYFSNTSKLPMVAAMIGGTVVGFKEIWYHGIIMSGSLAVLIALFVVMMGNIRCSKDNSNNAKTPEK
jgi:hypothetical protein